MTRGAAGAATELRAPASGRPARLVVAAAALLVAVGAALLLTAVDTSSAPATPFDADPGGLLRYGLPTARVLHDLAAALTVGLLVTAAWFVGPDPGTGRRTAGEAEVLRTSLAIGPTSVRGRLLRGAAAAAATWLAAGLAVLALTAAEVSAVPVGSPGFSAVLYSFVTQIDLGRALAVSALLVAVVLNLALLAGRASTAAWAAALSLVALLPLALGGHAAGSANHMNSVNSLAAHLVAACLWTGGLAALLLVAPRLGDRLPRTAARYSTLALWCFLAVTASGLVNAWLRLGSPAALATPYGLLVVAKTAALLALGTAGWAHRRVTLPRLGASRTAFVRLAVVEVLVMAATFGLAVALSRTPPPDPGAELDPVSELLGYPAPPPLSLTNFLTGWSPDLLWLTVGGLLAGLYAAGVVRLRRRGDRWPVPRTAFWLAGCVALVWFTSGGPGAYGRLYFSLHMIQHMGLMTVVPMLLVFGAPVTLALRALPGRTDGSYGPRETVLSAVHAAPLRVLGHPLVAAVIMTGSLVVFYYSSLLPLALSTHPGHVLMTVHFLLSGYLFVWSLIGTDPGPARPPYPFRLGLLLVTFAFHAFFAISLMASGTVLAADWFDALGRTDTAALLDDQQRGGAIAWALTDLPMLLVGAGLLVAWVRSDTREAKRADRRADRDDDAELRAYNERLAALGRHGDRR